MAGNPQIVTETVEFTWDRVTQRLVKGSLVDVLPGSALAEAIGEGNLTPMFRAGSSALPPEPPAAEDGGAKDEPPAAAPKKTAAKASAETPEKGDGSAKAAAP